MKKKMLCAFCILLFISGFASVAFAGMVSQSFRITTSVISGGGSAMSSDNFQMNSTIGQSSPLMMFTDETSGSENYSQFPGFWHTMDVIPSDEITFVMNLPEGWSMVSLPVFPDNASIQEVFPGAAVIYGYAKGAGYIRVTNEQELKFGAGY